LGDEISIWSSKGYPNEERDEQHNVPHWLIFYYMNANLHQVIMAFNEKNQLLGKILDEQFLSRQTFLNFYVIW
jgi:hypothetical protein